LISAYGPAGPTGNSGGTALSLAVEPIPANFGDIGGAGSVVPLAPGGSAAFFLEWTSVSQGPEPCYEVDGIEFGAPQALSSARKTVPAALGTVCGGVLYESVMFPPSVTG
jgi:hypothetical protein